MESLNSPLSEGKIIKEWVWYGGSDALLRGIALFYDIDYGTASEADPQRVNRVEKPGATFVNLFFAGVSLRDHNARSGGQFIEIAAPGSRGVIVQLKSDAVTVINASFLNPNPNDGTWKEGPGFGRAGAAAIQTQATAGGRCLCNLYVGDFYWLGT